MKKTAEVIKGFFAKDLPWKIGSLVIALVLWFIVMNTLNPTETKTFTTNLTLMNESTLAENGLILLNKTELENTRINIKVQGTRPALDELSKAENREEIMAYVDLGQLDPIDPDEAPQDVNISVIPRLPNGIFLYSYEITSCSPGTLRAEVDNLMSETMKLKIDVRGQLKEGYNRSEPVCDTDTVRITGPQSMFGRVAEVRAGIDITDKTDNISATEAPVVYDTDGVPMDMFTVEPGTVDISLSVRRQWQISVDPPEVTGELNENLVLVGVEYEPKSVEVEGGLEDINKIDSIKVPAVDLSTIEHTQTFSYDIRPSLKGTALQVKNGSSTEVKVKVTVNSKASRDIAIKQAEFEIIGLGENLNVDIDDVNITLYGAQEVIDAISASQLKPVIDISGKGAGWYNVGIGLTLPENVEIRVIPNATVVISSREQGTQEPVTVQEIEPVTEAPTEAEISETDPDDESGSEDGSGQDE